MGVKILEFIILLFCIRYIKIFEYVGKQNGFIQSSIIVWIQGFALAIYTLLLFIYNLIKSKLKIEVRILNDFYNTNFSVVYLKSDGQLTKDFERKIRFEIKINYTNRWFLPVFKTIIKNTIVSFELNREDVTINSNDRYVRKTQHGIQIPLEDILTSHIVNTNKTEFSMEIFANIVVDKYCSNQNNEEIIIYPQLLTNKNRKIYFKKIFLHFFSETYRFKLKLEETI